MEKKKKTTSIKHDGLCFRTHESDPNTRRESLRRRRRRRRWCAGTVENINNGSVYNGNSDTVDSVSPGNNLYLLHVFFREVVKSGPRGRHIINRFEPLAVGRRRFIGRVRRVTLRTGHEERTSAQTRFVSSCVRRVRPDVSYVEWMFLIVIFEYHSIVRLRVAEATRKYNARVTE